MQVENNTPTTTHGSIFSKKAIFLPLVALVVSLVAALCIFTFNNSKNTYIVYDDENITVYKSRQTNPSLFIIEEGLQLGDEYYFDVPNELTDKTAEIYVRKKNVITLTADGEEKTLYSKIGLTVSDVLSENEITLGESDIVSVPLTDEAVDAMSIVITRVSFETLETIEPIPFTTETRKNANLDKGKTTVVQKGVEGSRKVVCKIRLENGVETSREILTSEVIKEPVKKIIEKGTRFPETSGVVKTWAGETLQYKKIINMTATAYTTERTSDKTTATGQVARVGLVAVDPKVIPLGSKLYILSADGKSWCYGKAVAADTGVKGNKIDLFFNTHKECISFGRRKAVVYVLK